MKVDEVIAKIRYRLSDFTDEAYDNASLFQYINDGAKDFAQTGCCQFTETFGATAVAEYTPSLTYKWLVVFGMDYNDVPLDFAPLVEARKWDPAAGTPKGWTIWADTIYLDALAATLTNGLRVWYTFVPDDISATGDTSPLDEKWSNALVSYCVFRCLDGDRDGHAMAARAEYDAAKATASLIYQAQMMFGGYAA